MCGAVTQQLQDVWGCHPLNCQALLTQLLPLLLLLLIDHYTGITENWSAGPIYCSPITAALVQQVTGVHRQFLHPLGPQPTTHSAR